MADVLDALVMFGALLALTWTCVYWGLLVPAAYLAWRIDDDIFKGPFVLAPGPLLAALFAAVYLVFAALWVVAWGLT